MYHINPFFLENSKHCVCTSNTQHLVNYCKLVLIMREHIFGMYTFVDQWIKWQNYKPFWQVRAGVWQDHKLVYIIMDKSMMTQSSMFVIMSQFLINVGSFLTLLFHRYVDLVFNWLKFSPCPHWKCCLALALDLSLEGGTSNQFLLRNDNSYNVFWIVQIFQTYCNML